MPTSGRVLLQTFQRSFAPTAGLVSNSSTLRRSFESPCNAGGAGKNHIRPQEFFPRPSRTHPTPFPFPLNRPLEERGTLLANAPAFSLQSWTVRGRERGWRGCGGGGRKTLGPYGLSPASPALHLNCEFVFHRAPQSLRIKNCRAVRLETHPKKYFKNPHRFFENTYKTFTLRLGI